MEYIVGRFERSEYKKANNKYLLKKVQVDGHSETIKIFRATLMNE